MRSRTSEAQRAGLPGRVGRHRGRRRVQTNRARSGAVSCGRYLGNRDGRTNMCWDTPERTSERGCAHSEPVRWGALLLAAGGGSSAMRGGEVGVGVGARVRVVGVRAW